MGTLICKISEMFRDGSLSGECRFYGIVMALGGNSKVTTRPEEQHPVMG